MRPSHLLALHREEDLALAPVPGTPELELPAAFGDPCAERDAAFAGVALLDATAAGAVRVSGDDALDLLQRILAGEVRALEPGAVVDNLLLDPKGRVRFLFTLERGREAQVLVTAPGQGAALAAALDAYVFAEDVRLSDRSEVAAPLELLGPGTGALLEGILGGGVADLPEGRFLDLERDGAPVRISRPVVLGRPGWRVEAGAERVPGLWRALRGAGALPLGLEAREALRIEAAAAQAGTELPADSEAAPYPQEAGLGRAFSLAKGCYVGQEVVAKLDTYGGAKRALRRFLLPPGGPAVVPGTPLVGADGAEAGVVTSACDGAAGYGPAVLAFVKLRLEGAVPLRAGADGPELRGDPVPAERP